jgi:hydrogenase maturation protease
MNREVVDQIVRAVLYEGYILYPYRPSVKNRQRWSFGGIYPKSWSDAQEGTDAWTMQTEVLVAASEAAKLQINVRFLHLMDRIGRAPVGHGAGVSARRIS